MQEARGRLLGDGVTQFLEVRAPHCGWRRINAAQY